MIDSRLKLLLIITLSIYLSGEIVHSLLTYFLSPFDGKMDIFLHIVNILSLIFLSVLSLFYLYKYYFIQIDNKVRKIYFDRISFMIGLYYLVFIGFYAVLLYLTEETVRGSGWVVSLPIIGSIFNSYAFFLCITGYFMLPIGIIMSVINFLKRKDIRSQRLGIIAFVINVVMLILFPSLKNFILD